MSEWQDYLTEEERGWLEDAGYDGSGDRIGPPGKAADRMPLVLRRLSDEREKLRIAQYGYDSNTQLAAEGNIVILRQAGELKEVRGKLDAVRDWRQLYGLRIGYAQGADDLDRILR